MIVRKILLVVEIMMIIWFAAPFANGVVNAGNLFGLFVCGLLVCSTVFSERIVSAASALWRSVPGRIFVSAAAFAIAAAAVYAVTITALIVRAEYRYPSEPMNVVVLGCQVKGEKPSKMLRMRLDAAKAYLDENDGVVCVVSGGKGSDEDISEAQAMKNYLVENGIAQSRIIMEDKSENTYQNIEYSIKELESRGYGRRFAIVTDGFHQYRAGLIAKKQGAQTYAVRAKIANPALIPTYYVREWLAVAKELLS